MPFDDDDDVRRDETDELHGLEREWFHGGSIAGKPLFEVVGTYVHRETPEDAALRALLEEEERIDRLGGCQS